MVNGDEIVKRIKTKLEKMTKEEQLEYLKSFGFPVEDFIFNDPNKDSNKKKEDKLQAGEEELQK